MKKAYTTFPLLTCNCEKCNSFNCLMEIRDLGDDKERPLKYQVSIVNCWNCFTGFVELYPSGMTPGRKDRVQLSDWWEKVGGWREHS